MLDYHCCFTLFLSVTVVVVCLWCAQTACVCRCLEIHALLFLKHSEEEPLQSRFSLCWTKPYLPAQGAYRFIKVKAATGMSVPTWSFLFYLCKVVPLRSEVCLSSSPPVKKLQRDNFKNPEQLWKAGRWSLLWATADFEEFIYPLKGRKIKSMVTLSQSGRLSQTKENEKRNIIINPKQKRTLETYSTHLQHF